MSRRSTVETSDRQTDRDKGGYVVPLMAALDSEDVQLKMLL